METVGHLLLQQPGISNVRLSTFSPLDNDIWNNYFKVHHSIKKTAFLTFFNRADAQFFKTYHLEIIAGRTYPQSDTLREYVVNETLVKKIRNPQHKGYPRKRNKLNGSETWTFYACCKGF